MQQGVRNEGYIAVQLEVREEGCDKDERRGRDPDREEGCRKGWRRDSQGEHRSVPRSVDGPLHSAHAACKAWSTIIKWIAQAMRRRGPQQHGTAAACTAQHVWLAWQGMGRTARAICVHTHERSPAPPGAGRTAAGCLAG